MFPISTYFKFFYYSQNQKLQLKYKDQHFLEKLKSKVLALDLELRSGKSKIKESFCQIDDISNMLVYAMEPNNKIPL